MLLTIRLAARMRTIESTIVVLPPWVAGKWPEEDPSRSSHRQRDHEQEKCIHCPVPPLEKAREGPGPSSMFDCYRNALDAGEAAVSGPVAICHSR